MVAPNKTRRLVCTVVRVAEDAPPQELFSNPKSERTRQFLHAVLEAG